MPLGEILTGALATALITALLLLAGAFLLGRAFARLSLNHFFRAQIKNTLVELYSSLMSTPPLEGVNINLRAETGRPVERPMGSPKNFPGLDGLLFVPAQLARLPTPEDVPVDLATVIGPGASRPLVLSLPVLVSGMAYGFALSERAKLAIARGTRLADTATNSGEGPLLPAERREAAKLVLQYNRGGWSRDPALLRQADMLEIQLAQGSEAATSRRKAATDLPPRARRLLGLSPGQTALIHSRLPEMNRPADLVPLVAWLRETAPGIPVGVKLCASDRLEEDLAWVLAAGADAVTVDGAEAGTANAPVTISDDFGLPLVYALPRAARFLREADPLRRVTLIASGGLRGPADFLKVLALGAQAVAIGTAALMAVSHGQITDALPFEPPTALVFADGDLARRLDVERGARALANFLESCRQELTLAVRALGKTAIQAVDASDLCCLDPDLAALAEVRLTTVPPQ